MMHATQVFQQAFRKASGFSPESISLFIRLTAGLLICTCAVLVIAYFLNSSQRENEAFVLDLVGFSAKLFIAMCLALLFLLS